MHFIYNLIVLLLGGILKIVALFNDKIQLFVKGRKNVFKKLKEEIRKDDQVAWFHCASLGEFEQGRPVIEGFKEIYPTYKIVVSFFSPSGYEIRKDYEHADVVVYLPLDTIKNAKKLVEIIHPSLTVFVKYEFWPNLLRELNKQKAPTILVSGIFRKEQAFFKNYGKWMRNALQTFAHFFVQDTNSLQLLNDINIKNVTLSGDTRFDRVYDILKRDNQLNFIEEFKGDSYTLVAGSTWKEDEDLLINYINKEAKENEKFIIAPHNVNSDTVKVLKEALLKKTVLFSEKENKELNDYQVFIIDTVGILTKIYSRADVVYVGGGYTKSGIHNVLEPATFGVPIVIGPNYSKFKEASDLISVGACTTITTQEQFTENLIALKEDVNLRKERGDLAVAYIKSSLGASDKILKFIKEILK